MGLSRHLSTHPQCSLDYSKDSSLFDPSLDSPSVNGLDTSQRYHPTDSSCLVTGAVATNNDNYASLPFSDEFTNSALDEDDQDDYFTNLVDSSTEEIVENPNTNLSPSTDIAGVPAFKDSFKDALPGSHDNGLDLSLFSLEEKVQIDLLHTLRRLKAPMIAYDEVMKWAVRSCSQGHVFHDLPITSRKTVIDRLRGRVDLDALTPIVKELYLPYSNCHVEVVYFNAHAVFSSFLSCSELNRDENYIFHNPNNPHLDPFAKPSGAVVGDINTGKSYLRTYDKLVKNPEDMLVPPPVYWQSIRPLVILVVVVG